MAQSTNTTSPAPSMYIIYFFPQYPYLNRNLKLYDIRFLLFLLYGHTNFWLKFFFFLKRTLCFHIIISFISIDAWAKALQPYICGGSSAIFASIAVSTDKLWIIFYILHVLYGSHV